MSRIANSQAPGLVAGCLLSVSFLLSEIVGVLHHIGGLHKLWDSLQSWRTNWANLSTYFKYPQEVRRLIYTTNAIEGFNRQLRKVTKAKSVFPTGDSLLKMLYLAMMDITKKWTGRRQDWSVLHAQLAIY